MRSFYNSHGFKNKLPPEPVWAPRADDEFCMSWMGNSYFFVTGTTTQPEVDSVNSLAEKHQRTTLN